MSILGGDIRVVHVGACLASAGSPLVTCYGGAADVIHALACGSAGLKADLLPGRSVSVLCSTQLMGALYGVCSELCGAYHGCMPWHLVLGSPSTRCHGVSVGVLAPEC